MIEREVQTSAELDVVNVTELVAGAFAANGSGIGFVFTPHTTAALIVSEDDDPDLHEDLKLVARQWLEGVGPFRHIRNDNPNTVAHVLSSFAGASVAVPVEHGVLMLGTYQNLLFLEFDGPKRRKLQFAFVPTGEGS